MEVNYMSIHENILKEQDGTKKILLHSCCAPCSSYVISYLLSYFDITILYYNPNISPIEEYEHRKEEQIHLIEELSKTKKINFLDCDYDNDLYEKTIKGLESEPERGSRCTKCFYLRLEKTASLANSNNYDYFGTTLSVSPYKNSALLNKIGLELEEKYNIKYLVSNFKKNDGYKKSIELSKKYNLYRQNYCGCIYSKEGKYDQEN